MSVFDYLKNIFLILIILQIAPPLIKNVLDQYSKLLVTPVKVAVLPIKGVLYESEDYCNKLRTFFEDETVKALLLKIDSPGGAAGTSQSVFREILALKKEHPKPVVVLVENVCASGGYNIACAADYIIASGSAIIGSIGSTLPYIFKVDKLIEQYNVQYIPIAAGEYKNTANPFVPATPAEEELLKDITKNSYDQFVMEVSQSRKLSIADAPKWANGKIFTGEQSVSNHLIDQIGSISDAIEVIRQKAAIGKDDKIEWVYPPKKGGLWGMISGESTQQTKSAVTSVANVFCDVIEERYTQKPILS